jgi:hypothetical protein
MTLVRAARLLEERGGEIMFELGILIVILGLMLMVSGRKK